MSTETETRVEWLVQCHLPKWNCDAWQYVTQRRSEAEAREEVRLGALREPPDGFVFRVVKRTTVTTITDEVLP